MTLWHLLAGTLVTLLGGTLIGLILRGTARTDERRRTVANINDRIAAWWILCALAALALVLGAGAVCTLFAVFSILALRELLVGAGLGGRSQALPMLLYVMTAMQYLLVWAGYQDVFSTAIPIAAFILIPAWNALSEETSHYLERTAEAYWALMIATYSLSYAPALLMLNIDGSPNRNYMLLFYLLIVTQSCDILQYIWGKLAGRHRIAPRISPNKTWEGFLGGVASATALGVALHSATPFGPGMAALICAIVTCAGFLGGLTMSAIKRQRGLKDFGTIIPGHGGVMDRIDSLCFAAPIFYVLVRYFYAD